MSELKQSLRISKISKENAAKLLAKHPLGAGNKTYTLALGIFWQGKCEGVMTFGVPVSNVAVTAYGLQQCESLELRKMWCSNAPPKNTESRALAVAAKLIKQHFPIVKILVTYCDESEDATAYKAAGWIPQKAHRYVRDVFVGGKWYTIRSANRLGLTKQATDHKYEARRKWVFPLVASVAQLVRALPLQGGNDGSNPIRTL